MCDNFHPKADKAKGSVLVPNISSQMSIMNTLYFGDNLELLKNHIADNSVDLIYLDPPFNSNRDYNVLFKEQSGSESPAQIKAFGDTWNWAGAASAWHDFATICPVPKVYELMQGFRNAIGENDVMAYLVMMAPRLYHLHRVLKPTGSLYLHCDPTASHYLKTILDCIFGVKNFKNEVIWQRITSKGNVQRKFGAVHDTILYYAKQRGTEVWNQQYSALREEYTNTFYRHTDIDPITGEERKYSLGDLTASMQRASKGQIYEWKGVTPPPSRCWVYAKDKMDKLYEDGKIVITRNGFPRLKRYLDENMGEKVSDIWDDIYQISAKEYLGYPTQKPITLLERIVAASSNEGDIVLDPFCGCGTAVVAAQKLGRKWIGMDITPIATSLVQKRLFDAFGAKNQKLVSADDPATVNFIVEGLPTDLAGAKMLYNKDSSHKDFEMWAVGLVPAIPQEKKGADGGIDGIAYFQDNPTKPSKAVIQVKGGHVTANQIRDLIGVMTTNKAQLGFFISLEPPTQPMRNAALAAGYYQPPSGLGRKVEAVQIRTIEELLQGKDFDFPLYGSNISYKDAATIAKDAGQSALDV